MMRTTKIIIYPLILMLLFPVAVFAAEIPETAAPVNQEEKQEEPPVENIPEVPSQPEPIPEPDPPIEIPEPEVPGNQESETTVPETMPQEPETEPQTEETPETGNEPESETETESEIQEETETEEPETLLDEDTKGLLKEYLTSAVSGNSTAETPVEPENTEYQDYVKQALQVLQDNSTTQLNAQIVTLASVAFIVGLVIAYLAMRRFM